MALTAKYRCRIQEFRQKKGLTQEQLANLVGVRIPTIANYERNRRTPNVVMLSQIAAILGCSVHDLIEVPNLKEAK